MDNNMYQYNQQQQIQEVQEAQIYDQNSSPVAPVSSPQTSAESPVLGQVPQMIAHQPVVGAARDCIQQRWINLAYHNQQMQLHMASLGGEEIQQQPGYFTEAAVAAAAELWPVHHHQPYAQNTLQRQQYETDYLLHHQQQQHHQQHFQQQQQQLQQQQQQQQQHQQQQQQHMLQQQPQQQQHHHPQIINSLDHLIKQIPPHLTWEYNNQMIANYFNAHQEMIVNLEPAHGQGAVPANNRTISPEVATRRQANQNRQRRLNGQRANRRQPSATITSPQSESMSAQVQPASSNISITPPTSVVESMDNSRDSNSENQNIAAPNNPPPEGYPWMQKRECEPAPGKTRTKEKYRVVYSEHQRIELEKEFYTTKYITIKRKIELSGTLGLTERQIKIWFQNRRAKSRKMYKKLGLDEMGNPLVKSPPTNPRGNATAQVAGTSRPRSSAVANGNLATSNSYANQPSIPTTPAQFILHAQSALLQQHYHPQHFSGQGPATHPNVPHGSPHPRSHTSPHNLPHNLSHNPSPNYATPLPHNNPHVLPHNSPHILTHHHSLQHNIQHGLPHHLPHHLPQNNVPHHYPHNPHNPPNLQNPHNPHNPHNPPNPHNPHNPHNPQN